MVGFWRKKKKEKEKLDVHAYVEERCEELLHFHKDREQALLECDIIKTYFRDVLRIEELPPSSRKELFSLGKVISNGEKDVEAIEKTGSKVSSEQYSFFLSKEDEIPDRIRRISEEEKNLTRIKSDLNNLQGEKDALRIDKEELKNKLNVLQNIAKLAIILLMITFVIAIIMTLVFDSDPKLMLFVAMALAAIVALFVFLFHRKIIKEIKIVEIKRNKVIVLQNKVNYKYVNVVSALDYMYKNNGVHSSYELEDLWRKYLVSRQDKDIYDRAIEKVYKSGEKLVNQLVQYQLEEPEIWISQAKVLSSEEEISAYKQELTKKIEETMNKIQELDSSINIIKEEIKILVEKRNENLDTVLNIIEKYEKII